MTKLQLAALVRGLIPGLRGYLVASLHPLHERISALEAAVGQPGPTGPAGKDGKDGAPGRDGTLEGATVTQLSDRTFEVLRADGSRLGILELPVPLYQGVYTAGTSYAKGDSVTYSGSLWIARDRTAAKPGDGATSWQLAVKAGRDGKDGKSGPQGSPGPIGLRGEPGRDYR